jgi:hypothetical protein
MFEKYIVRTVAGKALVTIGVGNLFIKIIRGSAVQNVFPPVVGWSLDLLVSGVVVLAVGIILWELWRNGYSH